LIESRLQHGINLTVNAHFAAADNSRHSCDRLGGYGAGVNVAAVVIVLALVAVDGFL
jgi:hypothetical protein